MLAAKFFTLIVVNTFFFVISLMSILFGLGGGKKLLVGFTGIGGHNMIATEDVDDDLWIFALLEFVDDGLDDTFFQNGIRRLRL